MLTVTLVTDFVLYYCRATELQCTTNLQQLLLKFLYLFDRSRAALAVPGIYVKVKIMMTDQQTDYG